MDSTKLPQPTPPQSTVPSNGATDNQYQSGSITSTKDNSETTETVSVSNQPSLSTPPTPEADTTSTQMPSTDTPPTYTPSIYTPTTNTPPTNTPPTNMPPLSTPDTTPNWEYQNQPSQNEPTFKSPIIEGLKTMDSQPFSAASNSALETSQLVDQQDNNASQVPRERTQTQLSQPPVAASGVTPPPTKGNSDQLASQEVPGAKTLPAWKKLFSNKKLIFSVVGVLLLVLGIVFAWNWWSGRQLQLDNQGGVAPTVQTKLVYWGLWEEQELIQPLIDQYKKEHPNITIEYELQNKRQYRDRLQAAIKQGRGPDIFRFHNTWVPMLEDQMSTAPRSVISATELEKDFYPVVASDLTKGNQVLGIPLMYDGLALVYNTSMLSAANAQPPTDWRQVRELASQLSVNNEGHLERGGIALGTADNVDHFSDVLALLMMQNGANPGNPNTNNAQTALEFYTIFSRLDQVWDTTMAQSTLAFANEQVAMIIVPSWRLHEIERLNPNLNYGVSGLPQLSDERLTWATYWAEGVSKQSANKQAAWEFVSWLSQPEQLRTLYNQTTKYRSFGELYPRVSMASELSDDSKLAPYLEDALYARSWYMADATHDEGLNDKLKAHYLDAINAMNSRGDAKQSLELVSPGIQQVLSMYGVAVKAVNPTNQ